MLDMSFGRHPDQLLFHVNSFVHIDINSFIFIVVLSFLYIHPFPKKIYDKGKILQIMFVIET